jgi:hypothetical protein
MGMRNGLVWLDGASGLLSRSAAFAFVALIAAGCPDDNIELPPPTVDGGGTDAGPGDAGSGLPDTGIGAGTLTVQRVSPDHGPFTGGAEAVIRGAGFTDEALVYIGGRMVQPADTQLIDPRRLRIITPAGDVGPQDVMVEVPVAGGAPATSTLPDGYTYDPFFVDPPRGSVAGGTLVEITGSATSFVDGDTVTFGRSPCGDVTVVSDILITCRTPPGVVGSVDVTVSHEGIDAVIEDGFAYFDSTDPVSGGLGGGPLMGTLNVTVLNAGDGSPLPDAYVMVGEDLMTPHQGLSDLRGQITFSGDDLIGNQTVHVAKHCFEKTSFVSFDATDVTVFLVPWMDPMCGMGGPPPPGRGRNGTFINGELIWRGPNEYGPNPWANIPNPRANEVKVAYVFTTQRSLANPNPDPSLGGLQRVLEVLPPITEEHLGYPYRIFARPAGLAVYALAGLENTNTGEFIPYVMGIARNVLGGPGEEVEGADIVMEIPLDHRLDVRLNEIPTQTDRGPDRFRVESYIDLGGEGVIVREVNAELIDTVRGRSAERPFRFFSQPALYGALSDGRYRIIAGWYTNDFESQPYTVRMRQGVREVASEVILDGFLGVPVATSPAYGDDLPVDRMLRWEADGPDPSFHVVLMIGGDGNPAWRHFTPGDLREAPIPDLSTIPEITDITPGFIQWVVFAVTIPGFRYNELSYAHLGDDQWEAYASDFFTARF